MTESTKPAQCRDEDWSLARDCGLMAATPGTNAWDSALACFADGIRTAAAPSASAQQAEPVALPHAVLDALRFYANGLHFNMNDRDAWDTVSGEPQNFWCDEAGTATVEDGSIAKAVLQGVAFTDGEDAAPIEGEVYAAAPAPTASREAWAVELIQAAVDIMTPEQVGKWAGVRAFLETSAPSASPDKAEAKSAWCAVCNGNPCALDVHSASPAALTDEQIVTKFREVAAERGATIVRDDGMTIAFARALLAAQPPAAAEAEKRDAGRYRFMRSRDNSLETRQYDKGVINGQSCYHMVEGIRELRWGEELDAAIDAAMSASKEGER